MRIRNIARLELSGGLASTEWRDVILRICGITVVESPPKNLHAGSMLITNCSNTKGVDITEGTPEQMYRGKAQQRLYAYAAHHEQPFGILSDEYGIHFSDETLPIYNTPPSRLSDAQLWEMGRTIGAKCKARKVTRLYYVNSSPIMSCPYLIMLAATGIPCFYSTRLAK